jgi:hypothetical protein
VVQIHVLPVCRDAGRKGVRPANPLKLRRDVAAIQVGMVTTVTADQLPRIGIATVHPALNDAGRLTPQNHRPAQPRLIICPHGATDPAPEEILPPSSARLL